MKKIVMPEGMLKAAMDSRMETYGHIAGWSEGMCSQVLRAALRWLSENPMVPTDEQMHQLRASSTATIPANLWRDVVVEWQRRMFLAPEQDDPDPEKTRYREALEKLAKLGNGDSYGNSQGNEIAQEALGLDKRSPVPQQEKDFYHPDPIIETINKRMAEYSDWVHKNLKNLFDKKPLEPRLAWDKPGRKVFTYGDRIKK